MTRTQDRMDKEANSLRVLTPPDAVRAAAEALAEARVEFAEQFIRTQTAWKGARPLTDRQAHEMTVAATGDAVTLAEAELVIAKWLMEKS